MTMKSEIPLAERLTLQDAMTRGFVDELMQIGKLRIGDQEWRDSKEARSIAVLLSKFPQHNEILDAVLEDVDMGNPNHMAYLLPRVASAGIHVASKLAWYGQESDAYTPINFLTSEKSKEFNEIVDKIPYTIGFTTLKDMPIIKMPVLPLKNELALLCQQRQSIKERIFKSLQKCANILLGENKLAAKKKNLNSEENADYFKFESVSAFVTKTGIPLKFVVDYDKGKAEVFYPRRFTDEEILPKERWQFFSLDITDSLDNPECMAEYIKADYDMRKRHMVKQEKQEQPGMRM